MSVARLTKPAVVVDEEAARIAAVLQECRDTIARCRKQYDDMLAMFGGDDGATPYCRMDRDDDIRAARWECARKVRRQQG